MPKFSVIIPSVNGLPTLAECLTALERQKCDFDFEIIVVDRTRNDMGEYVRENFPRVKLIEIPAPRGIPEMRFIAMNRARGEFLAITEDHCIAPENWLARMSEAHDAGYEIVGGAVENMSRKRLIDWTVFLCEYSAFMPPIANGEVDFVTGNNTSYRRSTLEKLDESLLKNYWEYFLQAELKQNGVKFFSASSIVVNHKKEFGFLYFLAQRFYYSRSFAAMRKQKSTFAEQVLYVLYTPFLPFHQTWKIFQNVRRKNRNYREFFLSLPIMLVFMMSYALGELTGYLFGAGKSLLKVE
ncbi:MAG: glycosyltransferase [Pyrinomonadaceae bacterium]